MHLLRRLTFWVSILSIILFISIPVLWKKYNFEFTDANYEDFFHNFRYFGLSLAILLTLAGTLKKKDAGEIAFRKLVITLFFACIPPVMAFDNVFDGLCRWTTDKVLFVNKQGDSEIVSRFFGCGVLSGAPQDYKTFKIEHFNAPIIRVYDIDTNKIDRVSWIRVRTSN